MIIHYIGSIGIQSLRADRLWNNSGGKMKYLVEAYLIHDAYNIIRKLNGMIKRDEIDLPISGVDIAEATADLRQVITENDGY